ncbi:cobyrinate a,c-diamide synthase [Nocardia otitidiscaviarum]|uniref:cobyrinate a,c-diamide synthase n=1 Tax=Nocardia otitidiscaviarum TaxID=1823 RepID=UPI001893A066|nr:cobyrinate a,c-diamide synthase [Nocardia otitidiscaviarum]MBF6182516.1 cobyrinate a,c-diamide synthase [Nocardia otitidiscaviarum]
MVSTPAVVIAAPASGSGKTTVATGLIGALRRAGHRVAPFKVGPDYIDPGYHGLAAGRPGRNLDPVLVGAERIAPLYRHGSRDCDIAVVEGVMGLFDGRIDEHHTAPVAEGSTAQIAAMLGAPVVLVVDARGHSQSLAALLHGFATFDSGIRLGGVILNRVGSERHEQVLRAACARVGLPVLGALPRMAELAVPSRHLGLIPAVEHGVAAESAVAAMTDLIAAHIDLPAVVSLAASRVTGPAWDPAAELRTAMAAHGIRSADAAAADQTHEPGAPTSTAPAEAVVGVGAAVGEGHEPVGASVMRDVGVGARRRDGSGATGPAAAAVPGAAAVPRADRVAAVTTDMGDGTRRGDAVGGIEEPASSAGATGGGVGGAGVGAIGGSAAGFGGVEVGDSAAVASHGAGVVVAVAGGAAFTFGYAEHRELLEAAGARVVVFDPLRDELPPGTAGLVLPGGFPEEHAAELSANTELRDAVASSARRGMPIHAECAGLLYLTRSLDGHPMAGVVDAVAEFGPRLTLGYRDAVALSDSPLWSAGERVRGHEFHRTRLTATGADLPAWGWRSPTGKTVREGALSHRVHASYLHTHPAGNPAAIARFVTAAADFARSRTGA